MFADLVLGFVLIAVAFLGAEAVRAVCRRALMTPVGSAPARTAATAPDSAFELTFAGGFTPADSPLAA